MFHGVAVDLAGKGKPFLAEDFFLDFLDFFKLFCVSFSLFESSSFSPFSVVVFDFRRLDFFLSVGFRCSPVIITAFVGAGVEVVKGRFFFVGFSNSFVFNLVSAGAKVVNGKTYGEVFVASEETTTASGVLTTLSELFPRPSERLLDVTRPSERFARSSERLFNVSGLAEGSGDVCTAGTVDKCIAIVLLKTATSLLVAMDTPSDSSLVAATANVDKLGDCEVVNGAEVVLNSTYFLPW